MDNNLKQKKEVVRVNNKEIGTYTTTEYRDGNSYRFESLHGDIFISKSPKILEDLVRYWYSIAFTLQFATIEEESKHG